MVERGDRDVVDRVERRVEALRVAECDVVRSGVTTTIGSQVEMLVAAIVATSGAHAAERERMR